MIYRFGNYELDAQRCELRCAGHLVAIEPKVFEVLAYLIAHRDRVVTKEELLEHCWPDTFVSEAALTRCLMKVRKSVQPEPTGPPVIKTLYGRGYSFVAPVTELPREPSLPPIVATHEATPVAAGRSKILIVDDEPFNVDYLEQELEERGYQTISAANGQEALEKVAAEAPDLILLDVMMPALDAVADRIQGIKAGADDFLTKPVHEEELFARIATALKLKHTVDRKIGELRALKDHFAKFVRLVTTPDASST
jgi:DNA-binding response OmpR family regulator